jgi:hypothetical protein
LAKNKISSTELTWIFQEKLATFNDCPASIPIAIVPSKGQLGGGDKFARSKRLP